MIKKFEKFIIEAIKFNFTDDEWKDIENVKTDQNERNGRFLDYEAEFLAGCGLVSSNDGKKFADRTNYYTITFYKQVRFDQKIGAVDRKKDIYTLGYSCFVQIGSGTCANKVTEQPFPKTTSRDERIKILRKMMKDLYLYLWGRNLDPDSIKRKEEATIKHKDVDPYGEESWVDEDSGKLGGKNWWVKKNEEIIFNFDEEEKEEIEELKIREADLTGVFFDYEENFLTNIGLTKRLDYYGKNTFSDPQQNQYYYLNIRKFYNFPENSDQGRNRIIGESARVFYEAEIIIRGGNTCHRLRQEILSNEEEKRLDLLKRLIRNVYVFLNNKGLDPESIAKKEEERIRKQREQEEEKIRKQKEQEELKLKMKDVDPYGEEQWTEEDVNRKLPPPPHPLQPGRVAKSRWWRK